MRFFKKAFSKLSSVAKNLFRGVFQLEENSNSAHPDKYPDTEIFNYPFKRNYENKIVAKTNYELEAWLRIGQIKEVLFDRSQELTELFVQNCDAVRMGLSSGIDENLRKAIDDNEQKMKELNEQFSLSKDTCLQRYKVVEPIDHKNSEIPHEQFNEAILSMGISPAEDSVLSFTFIDNQSMTWANPQQLQAAGIAYADAPAPGNS